MNILRLVTADKAKKKKGLPNPEFDKLEAEASKKDKGQYPLAYEKEDLKKRLTPVQYHVTQDYSTERPYSGKYLRMKEEGVYTCIVCDNQLFRSNDKMEHACGWPSFSDVMTHGKVTTSKDTCNGLQRLKISCSQCGAHLGHVFDDGPKPTRVRYCVNSASLDFKKHTTL